VKSGVSRFSTFLLYLLIFSQVACSQEGLRPELVSGDSIQTEESARDFRVYRDALLQGSTDELRVDGAVGLLLQNNEQGRSALLSALRSDDNPLAREAVCNALISSRGLSEKIVSLEVFLKPLLDILQGESIPQAELAAEALLLFDYAVVADSLDAILQDQGADRQIRMNAVYALQMRTGTTALRKLIKLLDDSDAEVAKAAETALQEAFGIPVGASRAVWTEILDELQLKSPEDIRRERLLRQEMKLRQVQAERDRWQQLYFSLLDKQYETLDEMSRETAILEMIESELVPVRVWALDKASKFAVLKDELRAKLFILLFDDSRDVRLQASKVFMSIPALNPAEALLERMQFEKDEEVKLAMLEALGEACFFAFSPGSDVNLNTDIKLQTLQIASGYLQSESADCIAGAEVIRKILEINNLSRDSIDHYLTLLSDRYQQSLTQNGGIRAELLAVLAHLCGQGGAKDDARALFGPFFEEALVIENDPALRLAAVQGLSYVDNVEALKLFKKSGLTAGQSLSVQQVVIDVAGQTGEAIDLEWLLELLNNNGNSDRIWLAIKYICQRQDAAFLMGWLPELESVASTKSEYVREILDIAEQKAGGEGDQELLKQVRKQKILWFTQNKIWEQGVGYLSSINYSLSERGYSDLEAFTIYLYGGKIDSAVQYVESRLKVADIGPESPLGTVISDFFADDEVDDSIKGLFFDEISLLSEGDRNNWPDFLRSLEEVWGPQTATQKDESDPPKVTE
jgi:HEAT repeat protein